MIFDGSLLSITADCDVIVFMQFRQLLVAYVEYVTVMELVATKQTKIQRSLE